MALIKCPECVFDISDKAASCPKCGYSTRPGIGDAQEFNAESAVSYFIRLPGFAKADAEMRALSEPMVVEMDSVAPPRPRAIDWLGCHAKAYLSLVTDQTSWSAYRVLLYDVWHPTAYKYLLGFVDVQPLSPETRDLAARLDAERRHWHQKASEPLASCDAARSATPGKLSPLETKCRKPGRPTQISDELKMKALSVQGNNARAQILYGTKYPTPQQKKNVWAILRHFQQQTSKKLGD